MECNYDCIISNDGMLLWAYCLWSPCELTVSQMLWRYAIVVCDPETTIFNLACYSYIYSVIWTRLRWVRKISFGYCNMYEHLSEVMLIIVYKGARCNVRMWQLKPGQAAYTHQMITGKSLFAPNSKWYWSYSLHHTCLSCESCSKACRCQW